MCSTVIAVVLLSISALNIFEMMHLLIGYYKKNSAVDAVAASDEWVNNVSPMADPVLW